MFWVLSGGHMQLGESREGMVVTACVTSFLWLERILKDFPVKFHKKLRNKTRVSSLS